VLYAVLLLAAGASFFWGQGLSAMWARQMAVRHLREGEISVAQLWLDRADTWNPNDGRTDLLKAVCYRQLHDARWAEAMQMATENGVAKSQHQYEHRMQLIQSGELRRGAEDQLLDTAGEPATPYDVPAAIIYGYLANQECDKAENLLTAWEADYPEEAHIDFMRGKYWEQRGDADRARTCFDEARTRQPQHELSRIALAEMAEAQDDLDSALDEYIQLRIMSPTNARFALGLARTLRKLGCADAARSELTRFVSRCGSSNSIQAELGRLDIEIGNYAGAEEWIKRAVLETTDDTDTLDLAATVRGLQGKFTQSERLFARSQEVRDRISRAYNLRTRLALGKGDRAAYRELELLTQEQNKSTASDEASSAGTLDAQQSNATTSQELYVLHCSNCHGVDGAGDGRAARHLHPRPRNLRNESSRLTSTDNGLPTVDDLVTVLREGIPGTSMRAYPELTDEALNGLAQEVLRRRRDGLRDFFVSILISEGEEIVETEVSEFVEFRITPGRVVRVPSICPSDATSLSQGKQLYSAQGCVTCHGLDGVGDWEQTWFDERQRPLRPRDLVHEPLKGGSDAESVYQRVALGMPGTPHPASSTLTEAQLIALVHYCRSLFREPRPRTTNYQRALLATSPAYLWSLGRTRPNSKKSR
jgi:mono/diheme cytochrome c family protein